MRLPGLTATFAWLLASAALSAARGDGPDPLPGTRPLTADGDVASELVAGVDRFLLRKTGESVAKRSAYWARDFGSPERYTASVEPNRTRLALVLGARDPRVAFDAPELVGTTARPALIGRGEGYEVFAARWPAFGGVHGEGLLLVPTGRAEVADVVALPDADQTPEQAVGLADGVEPGAQFARRLAESGCRVLVPVLIDRAVENRSPDPGTKRVRLTSREFLYRSAFELGRHVIGYEVQKVRAAVDWFETEAKAKGADAKVGVIGWGEGGMLALDAAAIDTRVDCACVGGYFAAREGLWSETLDRNVFGLLEQFGDAEVASLVAPRALVIESIDYPEFAVPPGTGGGPGRLTRPENDEAAAEFRRLQALVGGLRPSAKQTFVGRRGTGAGRGVTDPASLSAFLAALDPAAALAADGPAPRPLGPLPDPDARRKRQFHEIDRHNQELLADSPVVRKAYFAKLDASSLDAYNRTIEPYRAAFRDDMIGHFDEPLLPPDVRSRRVYDEPTVTGYEVVMDVFPDVIACGILLVPKGIKDGERRPVVVCQHGLEGRPKDVADPKVDHPAYHRFAFALAERGFVTFSPQNLYLFGDRFRTLQRKANPLKKTLFSVIVPQHQQVTDWLKGLPFVDPSRIGFYGLSYGGKSAMRIPPLVPNYALSICSADFNEWVGKNASTRLPQSYVWTGEYEIFEWDLGGTFNYAEMAALIAPRPFMVERGHFDGVGTDEAVGHEFARVRNLYEARLGLGDRCEIEWFVGPHTIHGVGTFAFLQKHLSWPPRAEPVVGRDSPVMRVRADAPGSRR